MQVISTEALKTFVNENIDEFHNNKARILTGIQLKKVLLSKNPYLFKAKNLNSANDLINDVLSAYLYSSEEKVFGDFLEKLAIFVSESSCGGRKSSATGVDLEFEDDGKYYLVSIKSGPNWSNSSSMARQIENFRKAVTVRRQNYPNDNIIPVIGICYGKKKPVDKGTHKVVMGQSFWHLISGDTGLYKQIIEPLGYKAREHNEEFIQEKSRIVNLFTQEFVEKFCDNGNINWDKLVEFNSGNYPTTPDAN